MLRLASGVERVCLSGVEGIEESKMSRCGTGKKQTPPDRKHDKGQGFDEAEHMQEQQQVALLEKESMWSFPGLGVSSHDSCESNDKGL